MNQYKKSFCITLFFRTYFFDGYDWLKKTVGALFENIVIEQEVNAFFNVL